ncbi:hypothetical protein M5K25_006438 [Dendrobium thyrsiflorum]|uniref:Uncharacterized protein n=1 Tax=Dendrobium thyrsiflorum TaxID=117978 RepID=A0ABD0VBV9_DENTH
MSCALAIHSNHSLFTLDLLPIYKLCHSRKSINRALILLEKGPKPDRIKRKIGDRSCLIAPRSPPDHHLTPECRQPDVLPDHHLRPDVLPDHHLRLDVLPDHHLTPDVLPDHHLTPDVLPDHHMTSDVLPDHHLMPDVMSDHRQTTA